MHPIKMISPKNHVICSRVIDKVERKKISIVIIIQLLFFPNKNKSLKKILTININFTVVNEEVLESY